MRNFYRFTEYNSWEGETWHFYVQLTKNQHQQISRLIKDNDSYELGSFTERHWSEVEVDIVVKNTGSGYMDFHQKVSMASEIPPSVDWHEDDPFYKGQFWTTFVPESQEENANE